MKNIGSNALGSVNELKAMIWLINQGYEVFYNIEPTGKADIIAWNSKTDETIKIDVKTVRIYMRADGSKQYNSSLGKSGKRHDFVKYLGYCPDEDIFMWL
jgi:hypothetical protein